MELNSHLKTGNKAFAEEQRKLEERERAKHKKSAESMNARTEYLEAENVNSREIIYNLKREIEAIKIEQSYDQQYEKSIRLNGYSTAIYPRY